MARPESVDPYLGNVLVRPLGPILSPEELLPRMTYLPTIPRGIGDVPRHIRVHHLMCVRDLHIPPLIERQLAQSVDLMIRQSYKYRDPSDARTWSVIGGEAHLLNSRIRPASAASAEGHSGVGKTVGCSNCLQLYPQTIMHGEFPRLKGGLLQVVHASVEVPPSGKSTDLARELMRTWDEITGGSRFAASLRRATFRDGLGALNEWRQVAMSHFLGILHLDEIQNFFRLASIKQRRNRKGATDVPELSIVEDQCLKWVLNLINTGQIAVLFSGTPDGMAALTRRLSTLSRLNTMGYHPFDRFSDAKDPAFLRSFLGQLGRYQFVQKPLPVNSALADLVIELTAGVQRLIIALWVAAHRVAFERKDDDLRLDDFRIAANTWLAPVAPAVAALRSGDTAKMAKYEDLIVRESAFWGRFWSAAQAPN